MTKYEVARQVFVYLIVDADCPIDAERKSYETPIEEWEIGDSSIIRVEECND